MTKFETAFERNLKEVLCTCIILTIPLVHHLKITPKLQSRFLIADVVLATEIRSKK